MKTMGAVVTATLLCLPTLVGAAPRLVDRVAAVVNGEMVPFSEVRERATPELMRLEQEGLASSDRRQATHKAALDDLIAERLMRAEQKALAIEVTDAEVDYAIEDVRKQNRMDKETFERALMAQGLTARSYREKLKKDLAAMKLIGMKVRSKVKVGSSSQRRCRLEPIFCSSPRFFGATAKPVRSICGETRLRPHHSPRALRLT